MWTYYILCGNLPVDYLFFEKSNTTFNTLQYNIYINVIVMNIKKKKGHRGI